MDSIPEFPGIEIQFGGRAFVLAPLNFEALEVLQDPILNWKGGLDPASRKVVVDCVLASLKLNHPEVTREFVQRHLNVANMLEVMGYVMDVGGLKRKEIEAGKVTAGRSNGLSGTISTAMS
jgi:hypothetical protein